MADIPATGHSYGEPVWNWSEDGKTCTVTFTCEKDENHKETPEVKVTSAVKTPATCTETGVTTYTASVEFNGQIYTDTKDLTDIPATGHSYENGKCTVCGAADPDYKPITDSPQTGESHMVLLYVLLFISSGTAIALSAGNSKRKKY